MGLQSEQEAKQLANYLKRFFFRNTVYVSPNSIFLRVTPETYRFRVTRK